jgi:nitroimidazol reductase NimA-like FMN-containing flavoprotein (pyridoxamine 5'-phosphate oxidase superfamily)
MTATTRENRRQKEDPVREAEYEVLSESECRRLLAESDVGRVAFVDGDFPVVLPVNFVLDGDHILIQSDVGAKTSGIPLHPVAFEVDGVERWNHSGWSVLVQGFGRDVTESADAASEELRTRPVDTWVPGEKERWLTIDIRAISGRRLNVHMGTSSEVAN